MVERIKNYECCIGCPNLPHKVLQLYFEKDENDQLLTSFFLVLCFSFLLVAKSLVLHYVNCQLSRKRLLNALTSFGKTWYLRMSNAMCTTGIFPHLELDQLIYLASIMFTWQLFLGQSKFKVEKCREKFGGTERIPLWKFVLYSYYKLLLIFIVH